MSVYAGGDFSAPVISVARSSIAAGPVGAFLEFGTRTAGHGGASEGSLRVLRFFHRGMRVLPGSRVVLDWQTRRELSSAVGHQTTALLWHHSGATIDAYRVRFGGGEPGSGFYIPELDGSDNTEADGVSVAPNTPVLTTVAHGDLVRNDAGEPDGDRELVVYARDAATKAWSVYGTDAAAVPFRLFKAPPVVAAADFLVGVSTAVVLAADREFRVVPLNGALGAGLTQAVELLSPALAAQQGSAASLSSGGAGLVIVSGLSGMRPDSVGRSLAVSGAAAAENNGLFPITAYTSQQVVVVANASAVVPDANNGAVLWREEGGATTDAPVFEPHQDGAPLVPTGADLVPLLASPLVVEGDASLLCVVLDAYGQSALRIVPLSVRRGTPFEGTRGDAGYRYAVPARTREKDPALQDRYLPPWDAVAYQAQRVAASMQDLVDPQEAPTDALPWMFREMGLLYPNVAGYPEAAMRRLLDNADAVHRSRFTLEGLRFYLGLLIPNSSVDVFGFPRARFFYLNAPGLGFPSRALIQTAGTDLDDCIYLFAPLNYYGALTVTVAGPVVQGGSAASFTDSGTPGLVSVLGLTGMTSGSVGRYITLSGVGDMHSRGTWRIMEYMGPTEVWVDCPAAVLPDPRNGHLVWAEKRGAVVSSELKELVRATIKREVPMSDDPVSPRVINVVFAE